MIIEFSVCMHCVRTKGEEGGEGGIHTIHTYTHIHRATQLHMYIYIPAQQNNGNALATTK